MNLSRRDFLGVAGGLAAGIPLAGQVGSADDFPRSRPPARVDQPAKKLAVVFSSVVFWLMHSLNPSAWSSPLVGVNLFGAGVVLALAYRVSGNIWFPTALHFAWNIGQGVVLQLPVSGIRMDGVVDLEVNGAMPAWLTGGEFGLEASVLVTAVEAAQVLLFVWIFSGRRDAVSPVVLLQASPTHESIAS